MKLNDFSKMSNVLSFLLITGIISTFYFFVRFNPQPPSKNTESTSQKAIDLAKKLYQEKKTQGLNLSNGPCLSNTILPDWAVDIAHNPRQPVDNLPENQCSALREDKAHHFIELDTNGNILRVF